jgi:hypothetical protein
MIAADITRLVRYLHRIVCPPMQLVYRVENEYGWGPYRMGAHEHWSKTDMGFNDDGTSRWPTPARDGLDESLIPKDARASFAFVSIEQLMTWFDAYEREMLARAGYRVACYATPARQVVHGRSQCMFWGRDRYAHEANQAIRTFELADVQAERMKACDLQRLLRRYWRFSQARGSAERRFWQVRKQCARELRRIQPGDVMALTRRESFKRLTCPRERVRSLLSPRAYRWQFNLRCGELAHELAREI